MAPVPKAGMTPPSHPTLYHVCGTTSLGATCRVNEDTLNVRWDRVKASSGAGLVTCADTGDLFHVYSCFLCYFSTVGVQVAALVQFLIESSPAIFGDEMEAAFAMLLKAAQETDDPSGQHKNDGMKLNLTEI